MKTLSKHLLIAIILTVSYYTSFAVDNIRVTKVQTIVEDGTISTEQFGRNVRINGNYLVVSGHDWGGGKNDGNSVRGAGRVHIYKLGSDNKWKKSQILEPDSLNRHNLFGITVYSKDDILAIGAISEDKINENGDVIIRLGAVYIYKFDKSEDKWVRTQKIQPESILEQAAFGFSIAMYDEDLYIGAPYSLYINENSSTQDKGKGNVFRYRYNPDIGQYESHDKLSMPNDEELMTLGFQMFLYEDRMILGDETYRAVKSNKEFRINTGRLDYYKYDTDEDMFLHQKAVLPSDIHHGQSLGYSLYIDGGKLYSFKYRGRKDNNQSSFLDWRDDINIYKFKNDESLELTQIIKPTSKGSMHYTDGSMAISGNIMAIGGSTDNMDENGENAISGAGSIHLYTRAGADENWEYSRKIVMENRKQGYLFGYGLDMQGNTLVVGALHDTIIDEETGQARIGGVLHVYEIDTTVSSVKAIDENASTPQITISPNPISNETSIEIPAMEEVRVYLSDVTGATVREIWAGTADVPTSVMMDASGLATGEYFVVVESEGGVMSEKIVVER